MPTTTKPRSPRKKADGDGGGPAHALQQVLDELGRLREQSPGDFRRQLDSAVKRIRESADEIRERTDERTASVEKAVARIADEAWLQLATLAVRALSSTDALTELSDEIRKRKTQLRPRTTTRKTTAK